MIFGGQGMASCWGCVFDQMDEEKLICAWGSLIYIADGGDKTVDDRV
jgi:hypothetical protein